MKNITQRRTMTQRVAVAILGTFAASFIGLTATATSASAAVTPASCTGYVSCVGADAGYESNTAAYWFQKTGQNAGNYVAYRLNSNGLTTAFPADAYNIQSWPVASQKAGHTINENVALPKTGDVAFWGYGDPDFPKSHVAIVEKVSGNSVTISEVVTGGDFRVRTLSRGAAGYPQLFITYKSSGVSTVKTTFASPTAPAPSTPAPSTPAPSDPSPTTGTTPTPTNTTPAPTSPAPVVTTVSDEDLSPQVRLRGASTKSIGGGKQQVTIAAYTLDPDADPATTVRIQMYGLTDSAWDFDQTFAANDPEWVKAVTMPKHPTRVLVTAVNKNAGYNVTVASFTAQVADKTSVSLSAKSKVSTKRTSVKVKVSNRTGSDVPSGKVVIKDGRKTVATKSLFTSSKGKVTVRLPKMKKGKHTLRAYFVPASGFDASQSGARKVRVK